MDNHHLDSDNGISQNLPLVDKFQMWIRVYCLGCCEPEAVLEVENEYFPRKLTAGP